jgi:single-strand DNA-binding protein
MYLNKAFIFGNLTSDPQLKALPSGTHVATFGIATNRAFKGRDGKTQQETQFHNIVVFGRQAETVSQYLKKGGSVLIEGRIQSRSWEGADKQKRYRTEIVADRVQFGPRAGGSGAPRQAGSNEPQGEDGGMNANASAMPELDTINYPEEDINPDDIPF